MVIITHYHEQNKDGVIYIISDEESFCPICAGILKVIGSRGRGVVNSGGDKEIFIIRRLRCKTCHKIHHELPDKMIPYKRHCAETVENVINGNVESICCDFVVEKRIKTWWAAMCLYFDSVLASLRKKYGATFSIKPMPREVVRAIVNANLWVHTRSASLPG